MERSICIRVFDIPKYGEIDGKWQPTGETRPDKVYVLTGKFEKSDIPALRQCAYCYAKGDDLYETPLEEALARTEVLVLEIDLHLCVVHKKREVFVGDDQLPPRWMVG